jgi:hypothetical protein
VIEYFNILQGVSTILFLNNVFVVGCAVTPAKRTPITYTLGAYILPAQNWPIILTEPFVLVEQIVVVTPLLIRTTKYSAILILSLLVRIGLLG